MIQTKLVSSLQKCFPDERPEQFRTLDRISMLRNERLFFQLLILADQTEPDFRIQLHPELHGALSPYCSLRTVEQVPVSLPAPEHPDDNYLRTEPGLYPDVLGPLHYHESVIVARGQLRTVWVELDPKGEIPGGSYETTLTLTDESGVLVASERLTVEIIDADLPEQTMLLTQWFHCDCLANQYHCEVWSEEHWRIIESFLRVAVRNGINLILTPVHTPPLDTAVGGERLTTQLVDVTSENGTYTFGFDRLDRWIDLCNRVGIRYFEIAHLFTQWGAEHAPKIMATENGVYKKIFGWETDATGASYVAYLRAFLTAFLSHMKARGDDHRCFFHISDEPNENQLASYRAAKETVADLLEGYPVIDALSDLSFYQSGVTETPIPASDVVSDFIRAGVPGLWTYYCCCQTKDVSNRMIAMPLWRTRSIGMQFYKYDIVGFLQWGYNFYNNRHSVDAINPYLDVCGEYWVPGGDTHSVYPAPDGSALESVRICSFYEALQDCRAMKLAERYYGKEAVVAELERLFGGEIRFDRCAKDEKTLFFLRERINELIRDACKK